MSCYWQEQTSQFPSDLNALYNLLFGITVSMNKNKKPPTEKVSAEKPKSKKPAKPTIADEIKEVRFQDRATIVFWKDGTKTVTKCHKDDAYNPEAAMAMCMLKKLIGDGSYNEAFKRFIKPEVSAETPADDNAENIAIITALLETKKITDKQKEAIRSIMRG